MSIGYACIALGVNGTSLKSCRLNNAEEERLKELIKDNLLSLEKVISYNIENGINLFRISSDIIPFGSHLVNKIDWWDEYSDILDKIGKLIRVSGTRVSMHPGQYSVLNSLNNNVVQKTIDDLKYHSRFLDSLNVDTSCKIVLHIGGVYGNKKESINRFKENYAYLDYDIKKRLVIENDERCYNIDDVLNIGIQLNIPVIFDNLHHRVNPPRENLNDVDWIKRCARTWKQRDGKQKIHYSQQADTGKLGAHAHTVSINDFLGFYSNLKGMDIDIMLETKDKNLSALKCIYCTQETTPIHYLEKEWGRYKYLVLSKSGSLYQKIRGLYKHENNTLLLARGFYNLVEQIHQKPYLKGAQENAALHIWGYFKDRALDKERNEFVKRLERFRKNELSLKLLKKYLLKIAMKYEITYLIDSYYFIGIDT